MLIEFFQNKKYDAIIAISLVIAIITVSTYAPELFEKKGVSVKASQSMYDSDYETPDVKTETAKMYEKLDEKLVALSDLKGDKVLNDLKEIGSLLEETKKIVCDEAESVKEKTNSQTIIERAADYKTTTESGLTELSDKVSNLIAKANDGSVSAEEIKIKLGEIKECFKDMRRTDIPETSSKYDAHGLYSGSAVKLAGVEKEGLGEQVKAIGNANTANKGNVTYLELNDELKNIADSLNPAEIYEYVRNNYYFTPYSGIRYGAIGTYEQRAGNDCDQAALLIALLNYKGYDAHFVTGEVDVDIESAKNWLGVNTNEAAIKAMSMLGIPTSYGLDEHKNITKLRLKHTWVKTFIPYDSYRGAGKRLGEKIWIELDPSFKQLEEKAENNKVEEFLDNEISKMKDQFKDFSSGSISDLTATLFNESVRDVDFENIFNNKIVYHDDYSSFKTDIENYLSENDIDIKKLGNAMGIRYIRKDESGYLPTELPNDVVSREYEGKYVQEEYVDTITFSLESPFYGSVFLGQPDATITFDTAELYDKSVTLTYKPETEEDDNIIKKYGSLFETPAYLVRVVPVIKLDGKEVLTGKAQIPGTYTNFTLNICESGIAPVKVENALVAGGIYGVTFDYNTINDNCLNNTYIDLAAFENSVNEGTDVMEGCEKLVSALGKTYFGFLDYYDQMYANAYNLSWGRCISECIIGYRPKQSYLMGCPTSVSDGVLYVDVDVDTVGLAYRGEESSGEDNNATDDGRIDNNRVTKDFMLATGIIGSYLEGYVVGEITEGHGVSTISIIEEANSRGIDILTLGADDIDAVNNFSIDSQAKKEIRTALKNGKIVIVPKKDICYYNWRGCGYIILNPDTGESAFMISGGLCGGESADQVMLKIGIIVVAIAVILSLVVLGRWVWLAFVCIMKLVFYSAASAGIMDAALMLLVTFGLFQTVKEAGKITADVVKLNLQPDTGNYEQLQEDVTETLIVAAIFEFCVPAAMKVVKIARNSRLGRYIEGKVKQFVKRINPKEKLDIEEGFDSTLPEEPPVEPGEDGGGGGGSGAGPTDDYWKKISEKYGDKVAERLKPFGDDGKKMIESYGDDLANIVENLLDDEAKKALELINEYDDDAMELLYDGESVEDVAEILSDEYAACFIAGTKIKSFGGEKNIETLEVADEVYAFNPETGEVGLKKVSKTFTRESKDIVHVVIDKETIDTTTNHPFYVMENGFKAAKRLKAGDNLLLLNGDIKEVESVEIEYLEEPVTVYNFEVEDWHTYFVSTNGVLVHNACWETPDGGSDVVSWSNHGYKHFPNKNMSWKDIVKSTKTGPAKYSFDIQDVEAFERAAWESGTPVTNGKNWRVNKYDTTIGAVNGKETVYVRIENSSNTIHGHPISEVEYNKLLKEH